MRFRYFDTTVRDAHGLSEAQHVDLATTIAQAGADVIALPGDLARAGAIAAAVKGAAVAGQARASRHEIERCFDAIRGAEDPLIQISLSAVLAHKSPEEVLRTAREAVAHARELGAGVIFSAEDAFRTERPFLTQLLTIAVRAGAETLHIPDSRGDATPQEFAELIRYVTEHVDAPEGVTYSAEARNDFGLAMANSLAALEAGATQIAAAIETPLAGLESALRARQDRFRGLLWIDVRALARGARLLIPDVPHSEMEVCKLASFQVVSGNQSAAVATVRLERAGEAVQEAASGDGPVDALYTAINRAAGVAGILLDYQLKAVTGGQDAVGEATVRVQVDDRIATGRGRSPDVIEASAAAYMHALNQILSGAGLTVTDEPAPGWQMRAWGD